MKYLLLSILINKQSGNKVIVIIITKMYINRFVLLYFFR